MYSNLKSVMARGDVSVCEIADALGIHRNSVHNKLNGSTPWTLDEVFFLRNRFFPGYDIDWLFKKFQNTA